MCGIFSQVPEEMEETGKKREITPEMTILDIVERFASTQDVFKKYDAVAGECLICYNLFEPLSLVISKYNLDGEKLLAELNAAIR